MNSKRTICKSKKKVFAIQETRSLDRHLQQVPRLLQVPCYLPCWWEEGVGALWSWRELVGPREQRTICLWLCYSSCWHLLLWAGYGPFRGEPSCSKKQVRILSVTLCFFYELCISSNCHVVWMYRNNYLSIYTFSRKTVNDYVKFFCKT